VSWPHEATFSFDYPTESRASAVAAAVGQEVGAIDDDRSVTTLDRAAETLTLTVSASDLVALRAATNTWLGLIRVAEETAAIGAQDSDIGAPD
jgi:KEOPS complex subunit Pcc1